MKFYHFDQRRRLALPGDADQTIAYATTHWVESAQAAIADHEFFAVALSGGSTPKAIFQRLVKQHASALDWSRVWLFWSDERSVPPNHPDSNFRMAMIEAGLTALPFSSENIHRMEADKDLEANSLAYERLIKKKLAARPFDLVMLGMGDDGHTASLFPHTKGLTTPHRLVIPNYITQTGTWRMSMTFTCINRASHICLYVIGPTKAAAVKNVLTSPLNIQTYPSQNVGTETHPALWILDDAAASLLTLTPL